ncbi:MAG TPA: hypothetical protein VNM90_04570, partial [Haliangium sp.]|nr:hypothetical protein [Haliangium sp.]
MNESVRARKPKRKFGRTVLFFFAYQKSPDVRVSECFRAGGSPAARRRLALRRARRGRMDGQGA